MSESALSAFERRRALGAVAGASPSSPPARALVPAEAVTLVDSYRRLADVFHLLLAEQSLDLLLERIADAVTDLIPHDTLTVYEADEAQRRLRPVLVRDEWAEQIMSSTTAFGEGLTGWAVEHREPVSVAEAHRDPRVKFVPGTPEDEPEALICVPLIARGAVKGALNIYRLGEQASFSDVEFELAKRFGDAAALALDNAHIRERLEHQAQTDSLTGLFNHRYYHERLREELQRASHSGESVSVLMLDLDDFKRVNDVYGHAAGDEVLVRLTDALKAVVRGDDTVCRIGGEEFAVIMSSCSPEDAATVAARLKATIAGLDLGPAGGLTVSIGLAQGPEHAMNPRELTACAEAAMMAAKARGKNQIVRFDDAEGERPDITRRDLRSMAHMKMLQSLSGKLSRLNDVREIGAAIADELRTLIDYHNCRVSLVEGDEVVPIAFRGDLASNPSPSLDAFRGRVGRGITGHVAATGETMLVGDAARSEHGVLVPGTEPIQESLLAAPIRYGARVTGVIVISKLGFDQFDEADARLLEVLGGHAAIALENARLYEAQRMEAESATALLEFSRDLASAHGVDATLERIVERSAAILGAPRTSIWLQDPATGDLVARAEHGHAGEAREHLLASRYGADLVDRFLARDEPFYLPADELGGIADLIDPVAGFAVAPLVLENRRRGCIAVAVAPGQAVGERELRLLDGLAHQAQLAIANVDSFRGLEETFLSTLEALADAVHDGSSPSPAGARAVADLAVSVGRELGLDDRTLERLELAALFHDIGNVGVPSSILAKPGRLTTAERRMVERHSELGERILVPVDRLRDVARIVRHCHERWDGLGYPDGKAGEDIALEARVIHVCDAYHAMTSDRPYRKRLPHAEACRRLRAGAGTQFDGRIVEVCLRLLGDSGG